MNERWECQIVCRVALRLVATRRTSCPNNQSQQRRFVPESSFFVLRARGWTVDTNMARHALSVSDRGAVAQLKRSKKIADASSILQLI